MKIEGRNNVIEALNSDSVTVNTLMVEKGKNSNIIALARSKGCKVSFLVMLLTGHNLMIA